MRVLIVGAGGTIGRAIVRALQEDHEIIAASRQGPVHVDIEDAASIERLFDEVPGIAAVVCCAASGALAPLGTASETDLETSIRGKLLGQVRLALAALRRLPTAGAIVLTSGAFARGTPGSAVGLLVNEGLEAFVRAAAAEAPRAARLAIVSPGWVRETLEKLGRDPRDGTPAATIALAYKAALESGSRGERFRPQ